jgi:DNA-binding GntR family transcriptional regulator
VTPGGGRPAGRATCRLRPTHRMKACSTLALAYCIFYHLLTREPRREPTRRAVRHNGDGRLALDYVDRSPAYGMDMPPARSSPERHVRSESIGGRGAKLVRTPSGDHIAAHIRGLIFDGELRPGMRVPQDAIASDLGVSRIPLREALIVLEREGWVTNEMHRGAFISSLDEQSVHDHYELYGLIFGFAAQRALARGAADLPERLAEIQAEFARATTAAEQHRLSLDFHGTILKVAASPRINVTLRSMSALVPGAFFDSVPDAVGVQQRGLAAIVRAMKQGDAEKASAEYVKVMRQVGTKVVQLFDQRSLFDRSAETA